MSVAELQKKEQLGLYMRSMMSLSSLDNKERQLQNSYNLPKPQIN